MDIIRKIIDFLIIKAQIKNMNLKITNMNFCLQSLGKSFPHYFLSSSHLPPFFFFWCSVCVQFFNKCAANLAGAQSQKGELHL